MDSATLNNLLHQTTPASAVMATLPAVLGGVLLFVVLGGFAILDTGLVRSKNAAHAVATSLLAFAGAILGFWVLGFGLQGGAAPSVGVGQDRGVVGADGFLFDAGAAPLATAALFVLRAIAAAIVAAIPGGAVGERVRLRAVLALALVGAGLIYPVYAYWVWGGGWLASLGRSAGLGHGVVDRAGAAVIHLTGGVMALVAAKMLGPRLGKYSLRGQVRPIPAHNSPLVVLGTLLLAAG
jgi:Amt family ammonium transporter